MTKKYFLLIEHKPKLTAQSSSTLLTKAKLNKTQIEKSNEQMTGTRVFGQKV